jgi:sigma-B regulation protein RsbU (phosphoserine phosphatase)
MLVKRRPWQEELDIVDRTMRTISSITDPEELVEAYWDGIGSLVPVHHYIAMSRRGLEAPEYLITRSSMFTEHFNPWKQRDRLPRFRGGLLAEIVYGNKPVVIEDLPGRLADDEPARFYLEGYQSLYALPQYDNGESINATAMLLKADDELDHSTIPIMHWHAGLFGRGTTNLVLRNQLTTAMAALDRELQAVGEIQRSLLPAKLPKIKGFELATDYATSARAGGDYYDFFPLHDGGWGIFIADVAGHGTPAAVLMAITHAIAHAEPGTHEPPQQLLGHLNERLVRSYTRNGTFITAFYAVLDPKTRTLTYSMAGHDPPRLVRNNKIIALDENGGLPLGILCDQAYTQSTIQLQSGDQLVLYTDGITEAMAPLRGPSRELFGLERLDELLLACKPQTAAECIDAIRNAVDKFREHQPATDDQTLVALRCL